MIQSNRINFFLTQLENIKIGNINDDLIYACRRTLNAIKEEAQERQFINTDDKNKVDRIENILIACES